MYINKKKHKMKSIFMPKNQRKSNFANDVLYAGKQINECIMKKLGTTGAIPTVKKDIYDSEILEIIKYINIIDC